MSKFINLCILDMWSLLKISYILIKVFQMPVLEPQLITELVCTGCRHGCLLYSFLSSFPFQLSLSPLSPTKHTRVSQGKRLWMREFRWETSPVRRKLFIQKLTVVTTIVNANIKVEYILLCRKFPRESISAILSSPKCISI